MPENPFAKKTVARFIRVFDVDEKVRRKKVHYFRVLFAKRENKLFPRPAGIYDK